MFSGVNFCLHWYSAGERGKQFYGGLKKRIRFMGVRGSEVALKYDIQGNLKIYFSCMHSTL